MKTIFSLILLLTLLSIVGCSEPTLSTISRWNNSTITVDGNPTDWNSVLIYLGKNKIPVGVQNDSEYLYIYLRPDRNLLRQAMMTGLTLWFDLRAENEKISGIRYPIGIMNYDQSFSPSPFMQEDFSETMKQKIGEMIGEYDVVGAKDDWKTRYSVYTKNGIEIALDDRLPDAVYEIKIPLYKRSGYDYAVGIDSLPATIGVGLELGKVDLSKMRDKMGERPPMGSGGGGMSPGGMAGGRNSPDTGMPSRGKAQQNISLDVWFSVQLKPGITFSNIIDQ